MAPKQEFAFEKKVICVIILCDVKSVLEIFVNGLDLRSNNKKYGNV